MDGTAEIWVAGRHHFGRPFIARLEDEDGATLATIAELDLWMDGVDELDALNDILATIANLTDDLLAASDATLGPRPRAWKRILEVALEGGAS